jgi:hypothetical protein
LAAETVKGIQEKGVITSTKVSKMLLSGNYLKTDMEFSIISATSKNLTAVNLRTLLANVSKPSPLTSMIKLCTKSTYGLSKTLFVQGQATLCVHINESITPIPVATASL